METTPVRKLHVRQHFHSVGHGLFYSFDIADHDSKEERLLFVYDCGTKSQRHFLRTEIKNFEERHGHKTPIHVLTLSRFDYDHFHGLMNLLEGREKGEMVFLPRMSEVERLFHYIEGKEKYKDERYLKFIKDPASLLKEHFKKIYFVNKAERPAMYNPNQVELGKERLELVANVVDENHIDDNSYLKTDLGWIFYYYLSTPEPLKLAETENALKALGLKEKTLSEIVSEPELLKKIQAIFSEKQWTGHESSLACIHGPVSLQHCFPTGFWYARRCCHFLEHHFSRKRWLSLGGKDFCVLTGSVDLAQHWNGLKDKLQKIVKRISIFTLPHHGEKEHWHDDIVNDVDPDAWVVSSRIWSILLPGHKVLSNVKHEARGGEICKVHEFRNMAIERIFILKN